MVVTKTKLIFVVYKNRLDFCKQASRFLASKVTTKTQLIFSKQVFSSFVATLKIFCHFILLSALYHMMTPISLYINARPTGLTAPLNNAFNWHLVFIEVTLYKCYELMRVCCTSSGEGFSLFTMSMILHHTVLCTPLNFATSHDKFANHYSVWYVNYRFSPCYILPHMVSCYQEFKHLMLLIAYVM